MSTSTMVCTIKSKSNEYFSPDNILLTNRNNVECINTFERTCASDLRGSMQIISVMSYSSDLNLSLDSIHDNPDPF